MKPKFNITISDIFEAGRIATQKWPTKIISVIDPNDVVLTNIGSHHHLIRMFDVHLDRGDGYAIPGEQEINRVLSLTEDLKENDNLLLHCWMGVSRSTALACGVLLQHGFDAINAYGYISSIRPVMRPNLVITGILDKRFNTGGILTELAVKDHAAKIAPDGYPSDEEIVRQNRIKLYEAWNLK